MVKEDPWGPWSQEKYIQCLVNPMQHNTRDVSNSQSQFSSLPSSTHKLDTRLLNSSPKTLLTSRPSSPPSILSRSCLRFASTAAPPPAPLSSSPPLPASLSSSPPPTIPTSEPLNAPYDTLLPDTTSLQEAPLQEHIGFLHDLGISFGYGPTSTIQWLLEHVYVYSGLGWGPSIVITALIIRISLFKIFYNGANTGGKLSQLTPLLQPIQKRIAEAKRLEDRVAVMQGAQELKRVYRESGVKLSAMFLPLLFQIPLGFGSFRLLTNLADLPAPGLETQSFLWLQDLTLSDPYLILPLATSAAFYTSFKLGGDLGTQTATNRSMRLILQYVLPAITGFFMLFWPACLQISFFTTSLFSLTQTYLFRQPRVRRLLRMSPIVKSPKPGPSSSLPNLVPSTTKTGATPPKGVLGGAFTEIKGAVNQLGADAKRKLNEQDGLGENSRLTRRELKDAKAYEARRKRELEAEAEMRNQAKRRKARLR